MTPRLLSLFIPVVLLVSYGVPKDFSVKQDGGLLDQWADDTADPPPSELDPNPSMDNEPRAVPSSSDDSGWDSWINMWDSMSSVFDLAFGSRGGSDPGSGEDTSGNPIYLGSWVRHAIMVDGSSLENAESVLTFRSDNTFTSTGEFSISGTYTSSGDQISLTVISSDSPGPIPNATFTYAISEDTMTTTTHYGGVVITEEYNRND